MAGGVGGRFQLTEFLAFFSWAVLDILSKGGGRQGVRGCCKTIRRPVWIKSGCHALRMISYTQAHLPRSLKMSMIARFYLSLFEAERLSVAAKCRTP